MPVSLKEQYVRFGNLGIRNLHLLLTINGGYDITRVTAANHSCAAHGLGRELRAQRCLHQWDRTLEPLSLKIPDK